MTIIRTAALIAALASLTACATMPTTMPTSEVPVATDQFIESTLQQYGIGPAGRVSQPDAVVVDEAGLRFGDG